MRTLRIFYGSGKGNAHRYQCRGDDAHVGAGLRFGIGGVRTDRAVAHQILEAVSNHAVEAAILASGQVERSTNDIIAAVERDLEGARYEVSVAARRYDRWWIRPSVMLHVNSARELTAQYARACARGQSHTSIRDPDEAVLARDAGGAGQDGGDPNGSM